MEYIELWAMKDGVKVAEISGSGQIGDFQSWIDGAHLSGFSVVRVTVVPKRSANDV